jgi:hypothetical protein
MSGIVDFVFSRSNIPETSPQIVKFFVSRIRDSVPEFANESIQDVLQNLRFSKGDNPGLHRAGKHKSVQKWISTGQYVRVRVKGNDELIF